ncbi:MAG: hypothetical protein J7518_17090 [Nocardioidaceae bacterium]|nr:hypothetical protein [Nocardioidaceae bacterium]
MRRIILVTLALFIALAAPNPSAGAQPSPDRWSRTVAGSTTTVTYMAFIPQSRLDAPVVLGKALCEYGKGYQFGGGGHTKFDWASSEYRVALNAVID